VLQGGAAQDKEEAGQGGSRKAGEWLLLLLACLLLGLLGSTCMARVGKTY